MNYIGCISFFGAAFGATLLALNISISGWAYIPFLLSNIATIYLLRNSNANKAIEYQTYLFILINILGMFRWLI